MLFTRKKTKNRDEVRREVERIVRGLMKSEERLENPRWEDFFENIDSLRIIELVVQTEKAFKITFSNEQLAFLQDKNAEGFVDLVWSAAKGAE